MESAVDHQRKGARGRSPGHGCRILYPHPPPGLHLHSGNPFPLFLAPFSGNSCCEQMGHSGLW